ncbi:MAG TPA: copper resistance CopC family protein [Gemmatimonadales bacterium]|nr:copper resistance CopC family protein [Gemmatimonadales bacterium]
MLRSFVIATLAAGSLLGANAAVHTHLVKAEPGVDSTVVAAPKQIRLWFNEAPEVALSGATLLKADNAPIATVKMAATDDPLSVAGNIPVALEPGTYQVLWRTGSKDGHAVRGKYTFKFDPAAASKP